MSHTVIDERVELKIAETFLKDNIKTLKKTIKFCQQSGDYEDLIKTSLVIKECQKKLDLILTGEYYDYID